MNDEVGMCLRHGAQCVDKQPNTRSDVEIVLVRVAINVVAFNVLEDKKRLAS